MHEILYLFKLQPIRKFQQKLINLEKPQNFSKTTKPRFQNMKCMNEKGLEAYQVKRSLKKLVESLRNKFGVRWECFGRENREVSRERLKKMIFGSRRSLI